MEGRKRGRRGKEIREYERKERGGKERSQGNNIGMLQRKETRKERRRHFNLLLFRTDAVMSYVSANDSSRYHNDVRLGVVTSL